MHSSDLKRLPLWLPLLAGCALGLWLGWVPAKRLDPYRELRPSPGRLVGLAYRAQIGNPPRKRALEVSKDNDRLVLEEDSLVKVNKLRSRAVFSLAGNRPDPAIEYLEEAVETTEGLEQALLRNDLAAALLARSWPGWKDRPGFFSRGDDLFRAVDLAAQTLEILPDLKEAQFNLALGLETLTLRETAKEEWRRYLALDQSSPWAHEARTHLRQLVIPVPIKPQPNAMNPEGDLDETDPAVQVYRAGRKALREQRYGEARVEFRTARGMWRSHDPRMAGWASYRLALCDYFDPRFARSLPQILAGPWPLGSSALWSTPREGEDLSAIETTGDPALAMRSLYLHTLLADLPTLEPLSRDRLRQGLERARKTGEVDLISRLESAYAMRFEPDRNFAGLHHRQALGLSLVTVSPRTRLMALADASRSMGAFEYFRAAAFLTRESVRFTEFHRRRLHPEALLQSLLPQTWWELQSHRFDLARSTILRAAREALRIRPLTRRLAYVGEVFSLDTVIYNLNKNEQVANVGEHHPWTIPPMARFAPDFRFLLKQRNVPSNENNLWPAAVVLHREADQLEGGDLDIPGRRQTSWWAGSGSLDQSQDSSMPPETQLETLYSETFGHGRVISSQSSREKLLRRTEALVQIDERAKWARILFEPDSFCCGQVSVLQAREFLRDWQEGLKSTNSFRFSRAVAGLMREFGVPLVQHLGPFMKRVGIVSGNGLLGRLPLAAICDPHTGKYLVELYELFILPEYSERFAGPQYLSQRFHAPRLEEAHRMLAIGVFSTPEGVDSPAEARILLVLGAASLTNPNPLVGGEREIEALARRFPNHRILRGDEATKENVLAGLQWATIAHFAAHGLIDGDDPDDTGILLLTGDSTDSRLTVGDIKKLSLPHLRLVVLSTCNSGRSTGSPESLSVASAFIARGVPAAIATLMPIDDRVAPLFFKPFYDHLDQTGDPIRALRQTQIDFARGPDPDSTLRIWAPYVVMISPGLPLSE